MRSERPEEEGSRLPRWASLHRFWAWLISGVLIMLLLTSVFVDRVAVVFLAAPGALAIAFGAVEVVAPRRFLMWRDAETRGSSVQRRMQEGVDAALGIERREDGEFTGATVHRVRVVGAVVLAFGVLAFAVVIVAHRGGYL